MTPHPLPSPSPKTPPPIACVLPQEVSSSEEVLDLLRQGNGNRRTEATGANQVSSRSHAVLQVVVTRTLENAVSGSRSLRESKLSLIDLAGWVLFGGTGAAVSRGALPYEGP